MQRRSFIGVVSSFFVFGILQKSKADQKPEFEIIEESVIIEKNRGILDDNGGNFKWIRVKFTSGIDGMFVPLSGCTEKCVQDQIDLMKKESKKFYLYRLYSEDGNLLNCVAAETPIYV